MIRTSTEMFPPHDILAKIDVAVACESCGERFAVAASAIWESQELLRSGYEGIPPHVVEPQYFGSLADHEALAGLQDAWERLQHSVRAHGGQSAVVHASGTVHARGLVEMVAERKHERDAIAAWENEGGRALG